MSNLEVRLALAQLAAKLVIDTASPEDFINLQTCLAALKQAGGMQMQHRLLLHSTRLI